METVEVLVHMPKEDYMFIKTMVENGYEPPSSYYYNIASGTVLPKGHGRLIDADEYKEYLYACETNGRPLHIMELDERLATVDEAPTIIEADKTESEIQE